MKQKDIILIIVVVFFSAVFSLLLSNVLIAPSSNRQTEVEVVGPITSEFNQPDRRFFSESANNPTQIIRIGGFDNPDPFTEEQNQ